MPRALDEVVVLKISPDPLAAGAFDVNDRRAAIERANAELAALRRSQIEEQSSPLLSAEERVRRWEALHGLRLPVDANHRLVRVIAADTALAVEQIHEEQKRRRGGKS